MSLARERPDSAQDAALHRQLFAELAQEGVFGRGVVGVDQAAEEGPLPLFSGTWLLCSASRYRPFRAIRGAAAHAVVAA